MLQEIFIQNFVLIDELRMELDRGLNILTGETGAGKSIIIDALGLIMGDRINSDLVRDRQHRALAQAVFEVPEDGAAHRFLLNNGLIEEDEDSIIITREINPQGRSSARINSRNVSVSILRDLSSSLLDLHLQHDHLTLLRPERYLDFVDSFLPDGRDRLLELSRVFQRFKQTQQDWQELQDQEKSRLQRLDFLAYQIQEIEQAALQPGEEEEHLALRDRVKNARRLVEGSERLLGFLYEAQQGVSAFDLLAAAIDTASSLKQEPFFQSIAAPLEEAYYMLQDLAAQVGQFRNGLDFEPGLLDVLEDRLHTIERLKTRYGQNIEQILAYFEQAREERSALEHHQEQIDQTEKEMSCLEQEYARLAGDLSMSRHSAASLLQERVYSELKELNLPQIRFEVRIDRKTTPGSTGWDQVELLFSANPGEDLQPLAKVASGGEISRVVLALKAALAAVYQLPTLIFDEIDVGVGGTSLRSMANKLFQLSRSHQVILVTHSPQVAAYADRHFLIEKDAIDDHTLVRVRTLNREEQVQELARMLGGESYSEITLQHAREMLLLGQPGS
ncbi:MAG TPA: DNA repair protein RecN [Syntrophomonadaceae bacterium]|nr:DNA repair protein RecN [Syntrophomonadaceae bacterium]